MSSHRDHRLAVFGDREFFDRRAEVGDVLIIIMSLTAVAVGYDGEGQRHEGSAIGSSSGESRVALALLRRPAREGV